jgi:hypothetical protein
VTWGVRVLSRVVRRPVRVPVLLVRVGLRPGRPRAVDRVGDQRADLGGQQAVGGAEPVEVGERLDHQRVPDQVHVGRGVEGDRLAYQPVVEVALPGERGDLQLRGAAAVAAGPQDAAPHHLFITHDVNRPVAALEHRADRDAGHVGMHPAVEVVERRVRHLVEGLLREVDGARHLGACVHADAVADLGHRQDREHLTRLVQHITEGGLLDLVVQVGHHVAVPDRLEVGVQLIRVRLGALEDVGDLGHVLSRSRCP